MFNIANLIASLAPVIAVIGVRKLFKKIGLGDILKLGGMLGAGTALANKMAKNDGEAATKGFHSGVEGLGKSLGISNLSGQKEGGLEKIDLFKKDKDEEKNTQELPGSSNEVKAVDSGTKPAAIAAPDATIPSIDEGLTSENPFPNESSIDDKDGPEEEESEKVKGYKISKKKAYHKGQPLLGRGLTFAHNAGLVSYKRLGQGRHDWVNWKDDRVKNLDSKEMRKSTKFIKSNNVIAFAGDSLVKQTGKMREGYVSKRQAVKGGIKSFKMYGIPPRQAFPVTKRDKERVLGGSAVDFTMKESQSAKQITDQKLVEQK